MTLIEVILAIVILSVAVTADLTLLAQVGHDSVRSEVMVRATGLGQGLMEQILSKRYDELLEITGGNWSTLGLDLGEIPGDVSTFDDVDDFNGFSETLTGSLAGFTRSVQVYYLFPVLADSIPYVPPPAALLQGWWEGQTAWAEALSNINPVTRYNGNIKLIAVTVAHPATGVSLVFYGLATTLNSQGFPIEGIPNG